MNRRLFVLAEKALSHPLRDERDQYSHCQEMHDTQFKACQDPTKQEGLRANSILTAKLNQEGTEGEQQHVDRRQTRVIPMPLIPYLL
jgi:hypothetical protein